MIKFAFFGTDEFAVAVLEQLKANSLLPALIITTPDKPKGRKLVLTPSPAKVWAGKNNVPLRTDLKEVSSRSVLENFDLFVVASYGRLISRTVLDVPKFGTLNIHPSLLPKYRGPAPIQTAILNGDAQTGVTIMLVDEELDHGPISATATYNLKPITHNLVRNDLAKLGADLLVEIMPKWIAGEIKAKPQNHGQATFTKKIEKSDGEIRLTNDPKLNYQKFLAYQPWPGVYFFQNRKRIKITDAILENGDFIIKKVIPEGRSEMTWEDYQRGLAPPSTSSS